MVAVDSPRTAAAVHRHRYPGVRSFEEQDEVRFFGRHRAAEELLLRVLSVRLLLQFAPSGAGKTSVLNAGLFPRLRPHGYFPFMIRLNEERESLLDAALRSMREAAERAGLTAPVIPDRAETLSGLLAETQLWSHDLLLLTPVLVFDQFEEVFTLRSESFRRSLARELGELSQARVARGDDAGESIHPEAKMIISLREEYLGKLEEMSTSIPDLFRERLRLSPLAHEEAREAIVEPARLTGEWLSPPFEFEPACLDTLIDFIDGVSDRVRVIEPLTLQLVCQHAESIAADRAQEGAVPLLALSDFGGVPGLERLVHHYYTGQLERLASTKLRRRVARMFDEGLLDGAGKRLMLEEGEIAREYQVEQPVLAQLVESRLLRREPRNESIFYEISHDRLTEVIARHRPRRLPHWVVPVMSAGALFVVVLLGVVLWALLEKTKAEDARRNTGAALNVLFGDALAVRLQEAGLSDALLTMLDRAPLPESSDPLAASLHLRRRGELASQRGTLDETEAFFRQALALLDARPGSTGEAPEIEAERAQVLKGLGDVAYDKGQITQAEQRYAEAVRIWDGMPGGSADRSKVASAVAARVALAATLERTGDIERAEKEYLQAMQQAFGVLRTAYEQAAATPADAFEFGRAMKAYADAALGLARVWWNVDDLKSARALAAGLFRLRPLSSAARVQLGTASAILGRAAVDSTEPWTVRALFEESRVQFGELTQFDPLDLRMRRELTAVQVLTSEGLARCAEQPVCRKNLGNEDLEAAEAATLDSLGTFRELYERDPVNASLQDDVVWALDTRAKIIRARYTMAGRATPAARQRLLDTALPAVDEAIQIKHRLNADPRDISALASLINLLVTRALVLSEAGRPDDASSALDEALATTDRLPRGLSARLRRADVLATRAGILKARGRPAEAARVQEQVAALWTEIGEPWYARSARAWTLQGEGRVAYDEGRKLAGPEAAARYEAATARFLDAVLVNPFEPVLWDWLRLACWRTSAELPSSAASDGSAARRESALRCSLTTAWMAWVVSDLPPGTVDEERASRRRERLRAVYDDRAQLAMHLRNDPQRVREALTLAEHGAKEAEDHARQYAKSPDARYLLADAYYGLAMMRHEAGLDGWEAVFRSAIVRGERWHAERPRESEPLVWLGGLHADFANRLEKAGRRPADVMDAREAARRHCAEGLRLAKTLQQRESAQQCLDEVRH